MLLGAVGDTLTARVDRRPVRRAPRVGPRASCWPGCRWSGHRSPTGSWTRSAATISSSSSYLGDELLATMEPDDRQRMLETSVLDSFNGPLVDAVTASHRRVALAHRHRRRATSSSCASTTRASGSAITICCATCWRWRRSARSPSDCPNCTGVPPTGSTRTATTGEAVEHRLAGGDVPRAMVLMRFVGPDLLGQGQVRTLRALLEQIGAAACRTTWSARCCGDGASTCAAATPPRSTGSTRRRRSAPPDFDPMIATPLRINVALGRGDVATALEMARDGDRDRRPVDAPGRAGHRGRVRRTRGRAWRPRRVRCSRWRSRASDGASNASPRT